MRERTSADDIVQTAYNQALFDMVFPKIKHISKQFGYVLTYESDLSQKISVVAIPWLNEVTTAEVLLDQFVWEIKDLGIWCVREPSSKFKEEAQGRVSTQLLIYCGGNRAYLDVSITPTPSKDVSYGKAIKQTPFGLSRFCKLLLPRM